MRRWAHGIAKNLHLKPLSAGTLGLLNLDFLGAIEAPPTYTTRAEAGAVAARGAKVP